MTRSQAVLAIDQGTSGTKAIVVTPDGQVLGSANAGVRPSYGPDGSVEQDPHELLESVIDAGRRALDDAGVRVDAIGLANQGETVLAWDPSTGEPIGPALVWQDRRSQGVCDRLAEGAAELESISGLPLDPYFAAPKMAWLREHRTRDGVVTTSDAWLVHRLTGEFVTDASTASRTMLLDLASTDWSDRALEVFGLAREALPRVVDCAEVVGETRAFGAATPLSGLMVDQQAALLAHDCRTRGATKCTYGTGAFLLTNTGDRPHRGGGGLVPSVAWRLGGTPTYCVDGQVYTVSSAVRWLVDMGIVPGAEQLDDVGDTVASAGSVTFVPAFAGLAAPWWRGDVKASLAGLGLDTNAGHVVRALFEGIAAQVAAMVDAAGVAAGSALTHLQVDGGLTQSRLLMQTQADLLQIPVEVYGSGDATAHGVAVAARMGFDATDVAVPTRWQRSTVFDPVMSADHARAIRARHERAVAAILEAGPS